MGWLVKPTLSLDEVAAQMGKSADWVRRHRGELHRKYGFPDALPGKPLRFSRAAFRRWLDHDELRRPAPAPANDDTDPALIALTRDRLAALLDSRKR